MIRDALIPLLSERFPGSFSVAEEAGRPCLTFPAKHSEVGDIKIYDDGDEITLYAGNFTHGHFSNYDDIPIQEKEQNIAETVAEFLDKLLSDRVVLWGSHKGCGGWQVIDPERPNRTKHSNEHVWSGPLNSESIKRKTALTRTIGFVGMALLGIGLVIAGALCAPAGTAGDPGLHRWTPSNDEQLLVYSYSNGNSAIFTSIRVVLTTSAISLVLGGLLIFLARRIQRNRQ